MGDSGEHKVEVLGLLKSFEKKLDMIIDLLSAFRERLAQVEARVDGGAIEQIKAEAEE